MVVYVHEDKLTIVATDPVIVEAGKAAAVARLGTEAASAGALPGADTACASFSRVWLALRDSLETIQRDAVPPEAVA
jgi:hypothetical protein